MEQVSASKGLRFFKAECHHKNYSLNPSSPDEIQPKILGRGLCSVHALHIKFILKYRGKQGAGNDLDVRGLCSEQQPAVVYDTRCGAQSNVHVLWGTTKQVIGENCI